jgi:3-oxoacyl-[acyl-carrier protein] reductase
MTVAPTQPSDSRPGTVLSGVAIVTGGAGDLGRACAEELAARGMRVAVVDLDRARGRDVVGALPDGESVHLAVAADVTSQPSVAKAYLQICERLGEASVLVNAAGIITATGFDDISETEFDAVMSVSVKGTFLLTRACAPSMRRHRYGRIVNFSSTAGKNVSTLGGAHYTTAKAALLGLTRATAAELGPDGITVNAICPGLFDTAMARQLAEQGLLEEYATRLPLRRLGKPWEVGALVAFLAGEGAAFITGAALDINGGELMV